MSNARRRRRGLHLPRSAWPTLLELGVTTTEDDKTVGSAIKATHDRLEAKVRGRKRTQIRWATFTAEVAPVVLGELHLDLESSSVAEVLAVAEAHRATGMLVIAYCDVEPNPRRFTVMGGG